jgi:3-hydroxyphenylacetate 6-hydroxylase
MTIANFVLSALRYYREGTTSSILLSFVSIPLVYVLVNELVRRNARLQMKGPAGLPVVGHLWDIRVNAAEKYREWSKKFGAVYQIQLGNIPVVVINSASAARAIFGQNAQAMSSRPEMYTFHKVGAQI